ncbi:hypothetical protein EVAR_45703_1 [Eumeta japonica]|uniref:Uncharacterized protein n=1 Tax=Eumeta variegata TaxID=151549 RepID=A0A4C1WVL9_EUMVA|nr:hypothetical protein EVAR_45703_1 [Eumeta japonica]
MFFKKKVNPVSKQFRYAEAQASHCAHASSASPASRVFLRSKIQNEETRRRNRVTDIDRGVSVPTGNGQGTSLVEHITTREEFQVAIAN